MLPWESPCSAFTKEEKLSTTLRHNALYEFVRLHSAKNVAGSANYSPCCHKQYRSRSASALSRAPPNVHQSFSSLRHGAFQNFERIHGSCNSPSGSFSGSPSCCHKQYRSRSAVSIPKLNLSDKMSSPADSVSLSSPLKLDSMNNLEQKPRRGTKLVPLTLPKQSSALSNLFGSMAEIFSSINSPLDYGSPVKTIRRSRSCNPSPARNDDRDSSEMKAPKSLKYLASSHDREHFGNLQHLSNLAGTSHIGFGQKASSLLYSRNSNLKKDLLAAAHRKSRSAVANMGVPNLISGAQAILTKTGKRVVPVAEEVKRRSYSLPLCSDNQPTSCHLGLVDGRPKTYVVHHSFQQRHRLRPESNHVMASGGLKSPPQDKKPVKESCEVMKFALASPSCSGISTATPLTPDRSIFVSSPFGGRKHFNVVDSQNLKASSPSLHCGFPSPTFVSGVFTSPSNQSHCQSKLIAPLSNHAQKNADAEKLTTSRYRTKISSQSLDMLDTISQKSDRDSLNAGKNGKNLHPRSSSLKTTGYRYSHNFDSSPIIHNDIGPFIIFS